MKEMIIIIEDDRGIMEGLKINLEAEGYEVLTADNGSAGLQIIREHLSGISLVILDLMLPDISGFEVLSEIRKLDASLLVFFLTARSDLFDKVTGFNLGCDDYLTKPFEVRELILRIKSRLSKRAESEAVSRKIEFGEVSIDMDEFKVFVKGQDVEFTKLEIKILTFLYQNRGRVITRNQLLERVWDMESDVTTRTVDMHVSKIRKKIEDDPLNPRYLLTVYGMGYKLECP
ncbi:MAG: response regulator transcription factor [Candidatus Wallbacteria bacterium]|nr:response regulator transcription factor [Candidatus Wallbacteria bacterium]